MSRRRPIAIEDIEADAIAAVLAADEAEREEGDDRRHLQTAEERKQWPDLVDVPFGRKGMTEDHAFVYGHRLSELAGEYREAYARRDPTIVDAELRQSLRKRGVPIDPTSDFYRQAGLAVLRGHVRGYDLLLERQAGKIVTAPARPNVNKGPKLSEAFASWKAAAGRRERSNRGQGRYAKPSMLCAAFGNGTAIFPLGLSTRRRRETFGTRWRRFAQGYRATWSSSLSGTY